MMTAAPLAHYLLFSEAALDAPQGGTWRFVLEPVGEGESFSASDFEEVECAERLELLALVRGLEALDHPSKVTLVTKSRYVSRGLKRGISDWRLNDWHWERFGRVVLVRDHDLWRRVDRALHFHLVDCRLWQFASEPIHPIFAPPAVAMSRGVPAPGTPGAPSGGRRLAAAAKTKLRRAARVAASLGDAFRPAGLAAG
jgi:ribonuclease HI